MIKLILTESAKAKKVIDPKTGKKLTEQGVHIRKIDSYWQNRINDGDVVEEKKQKKGK